MSFAPLRSAALAATLLLVGPALAGAADAATVSRFAARMKALQVRLMREREEERFDRAWQRELAGPHGLGAHNVARAGARPGVKPGARATPAPTGDLTAPAGAPTARRALPERSLAAITTNVRVNDPTGDPSSATQSETAIGAIGDNVIIAYNDGPAALPGYQGYSYSTNGGQSFTDGGIPPIPSGWTWASDPVITVNEATGDFWFMGLADNFPNNGLVLVRANFNGGSLVWSTPRVIRSFPNTDVGIDKPWMAVDPASGNLYVTFTAFEGFSFSSDTIDIQSSTDGGVNWTAPMALSASGDAGFVQGSRVVVGPPPSGSPTGDVYATWYVIAQNAPYRDRFALRKSSNGGTSFATEVTVAAVFSNFSSGAPGFNRARGITFPSMAVDRSSGSHRGRVYVAWNECVDFYNDPLGELGGVIESPPDDTPANATAFTVGDSLRGDMLTGQADFFKFTAQQGQTVIAYAGVVDPSMEMSLRFLCGDGNSQLALSDPGAGIGGLLVFTIPATGTYYLRLKAVNGSGAYTVFTGFHTPSVTDRSRDHRDIFITHSDDGLVWTQPVRANSDPPWLDNWLPEVAVGSLSEVYAAWFDWRDASAAICNAQSQTYLAHSTDGGTSWSELGALSDAASDWTDWNLTKSALQPNQGDYIALFADCQAVYGAWGDCRDPDVNVYAGRYPPGNQAAVVYFQRAVAIPDQVDLTWQAQPVAPLTGWVQRRDPGASWPAAQSGSPFTADGAGRILFTDATVSAGSAYEYRLDVTQGASDLFTCPVRVDVPARVVNLSLGLTRPNPTTGDIIITLTLPNALPATLRLLDLTGREVRSMEVGSLGPGRPTVNLGAGLDLRPGLYFLHLSQGGQETSARVSVVR